MWNQVKRIFRPRLPGFFGEGTQARQLSPEPEGAGLSETETVDSLGSSTRPSLHGPLPRTAQSLCPNQVVAGRFEILRFLNGGGMGEVYEAWDRDLRERIALKTIRPEIAANPSVIERFKREVKQSRLISHENVCRVYEVFSHTQASGDRIWFLTMELLEGQTLSGRLRQFGPFPPKQALELIDQLVAGLAAAHDHGIVHRDFKSSNVMLVDGGLGIAQAVITDFGLALSISNERSSIFEISGGGTPQYMAPEQEGDVAVGLAAETVLASWTSDDDDVPPNSGVMHRVRVRLVPESLYTASTYAALEVSIHRKRSTVPVTAQPIANRLISLNSNG